MTINRTLNCGVSIRVNYLKIPKIVMVAVEDPQRGSFYTNEDGTELFIGIREENLPALREIFDELAPKPQSSFGTHIREAFRILKQWGNKPDSVEPEIAVCGSCGRGD